MTQLSLDVGLESGQISRFCVDCHELGCCESDKWWCHLTYSSVNVWLTGHEPVN